MRRLLQGGLALLILALLYAWISTWFKMTDARALSEHDLALSMLMMEVAGETCVGEESFRIAAERLGWKTERLTAPYPGSFYDETLPVALNIHVSPPVPLSKNDYSVFQFDADGCFKPLK